MPRRPSEKSLRSQVTRLQDQIAAAVADGHALASIARELGYGHRFNSFKTYYYQARQAAEMLAAARRSDARSRRQDSAIEGAPMN